MAPTLTDPDGAVVDPGGHVKTIDPPAVDRDQVDREFSRAMLTDEPGGVGAPPRRDAAPATAAAPKRGRGRPRKDPDEKPRVAEKPAEAAKPAANVDYTEAAAGVVTLGWATLAGIPWTTPYAAVIDANAEALTGALANGAQHNPKIAAALEKAASGGGGVYVLQLAAVGVNMSMQTLQLMRDPELRAEAAKATQVKFRAFLAAQGINVPAPEQAAEATDAPVAA